MLLKKYLLPSALVVAFPVADCRATSLRSVEKRLAQLEERVRKLEQKESKMPGMKQRKSACPAMCDCGPGCTCSPCQCGREKEQ